MNEAAEGERIEFQGLLHNGDSQSNEFSHRMKKKFAHDTFKSVKSQWRTDCGMESGLLCLFWGGKTKFSDFHTHTTILCLLPLFHTHKHTQNLTLPSFLLHRKKMLLFVQDLTFNLLRLAWKRSKNLWGWTKLENYAAIYFQFIKIWESELFFCGSKLNWSRLSGQ